MPVTKKERKAAEKAMFKQVWKENRDELSGAANVERVKTAMKFIMGPERTTKNEIASLLLAMLPNEAKYDCKMDMWDEAMDRLYPREPESESDETVVVHLTDSESDATIVVDLD